MQETGPTVFRPHPRGLESLTICSCNYKGIFPSFFFRDFFDIIGKKSILINLLGQSDANLKSMTLLQEAAQQVKQNNYLWAL